MPLQKNDNIRVAVIGYGWVTRYFHLPLIASVPGLQVNVIGTQRPDEIAPAQANLKTAARSVATQRSLTLPLTSAECAAFELARRSHA